MYYIIKVGSITNAQRGVRLLKSKGYRPAMSRLENPTKGDGCGYVIKVYSDSDKVINILRAGSVTILGVDTE